jgi:hypothetical protein
MSAPTRVGCKVTFSSPYRGGTKTWSQLWHFDGPTSWASQGQFDTFAIALKGQLLGLLPSGSTLVGMTGYNAGSSVPVFTHSFNLAGTSSASGGVAASLEMCALVRFTTTQRSSKNHPVYLFKWFHSVRVGAAGSTETLDAGLAGNINSNMGTIIGGLSDGTNTRFYCGPFGAVAQTRLVETYVHAREFPT